MPMSSVFQQRLLPLLPKIIDHFGTPFHVFDEQGIIETGECVQKTLGAMPGGFREFFAVKALPTPAILKIMQRLGFRQNALIVNDALIALLPSMTRVRRVIPATAINRSG